MSGKNYKSWVLAAIGILILCGAVSWLGAREGSSVQDPAISSTTRNKILTYIRERFGLPDTIRLTLGPLKTSHVAPGFNEGAVTSGEGSSQRTQQVLVSKDSRYLIVITGNIIELPRNSPAVIAARIRETFRTPPDLKIGVGAFRRSPAPDFEEGTLILDNGRIKQDRPLLLTRDGKHLIVSEMYSLGVDPRLQALRAISLHDQPAQGPADAPVTIVEYADLECPTCARVHQFLETQVVPRYGNKVRLIFKEFPLVGIHEWSFTAAIACQCAYEINPSSYVPLRSAIFRSQELINVTNLRETLLSFGEQAGANRVQLAGCLDAKSSLPRVQRDVAEAKRLNINQTPTVYINGRMIIGLPSEEAYFNTIDEALRGK